jgi:hypothetical protein
VTLARIGGALSPDHDPDLPPVTPSDEAESDTPDAILRTVRRQALLMVVGAVVLVLAGIWFGEWALPFLGLFLGVKGIRTYRQPYFVPIRPEDVAQRVIESKLPPLPSDDRGLIAERIASLEDDLEKVEGETAVMRLLRLSVTRVELPLAIVCAIVLGAIAVAKGSVPGLLFAIVLTIADVFFLIHGEQTHAKRKEAAKILRSKIRDLQRLLPSSSKDEAGGLFQEFGGGG